MMDASTCRTVPHHPMLVLREHTFVRWLGEARPGDRIRYHAGHLATDRVDRLSQLSEARCRELAAIADRAFTLAEQGLLLLIQRRHGPGQYSYFAVKAKRSPASAPAAAAIPTVRVAA
jgi:hypothetical protein